MIHLYNLTTITNILNQEECVLNQEESNILILKSSKKFDDT